MGKLIDARLLQKTKSGRNCCRWCNNEVKPPRRTICSKSCQHEILLRTSGRYLRDCVYNRDKGICKICNLDTKTIAREANRLYGTEKEQFLKNNMISLKRKIWIKKHGGGLWDADHIVRVADGGGMCGLDNMRTLCIPCHKIITFSVKNKKKTKKDTSIVNTSIVETNIVNTSIVNTSIDDTNIIETDTKDNIINV